MFAHSQRFETGYCSNCNKKILLIRRGLGYEWRCKECGTVCTTEHKVDAEKAVKEGCTLNMCTGMSIFIIIWLFIIGKLTNIQDIAEAMIVLPPVLYILARVLVLLQK